MYAVIGLPPFGGAIQVTVALLFAALATRCIRIQTTATLPAKVQTRVQWD